jgi:NADH-quinone oxidoreductase subunit F
MTLLHRVLDEHVVTTMEDHVALGGGRGLEAAHRLGAAAIVDEVERSGLRGRGGAGFPTGRKWRTVLGNASTTEPIPVVVNAAEGEPGTFKDRALLRRNPYKVLEGALIAALAVGASEVVVALKSSSEREAQRVRDAIAVARAAGWLESVAVRIVEGPASYLYGEETALLEVVEGRPPFPRVTPPYRRGLDEGDPDAANTAATVDLAGSAATDAAPALVDNVETLANLPGILADGVDWFRSVGTPESPGTIVCTITGATARHGVGEVAMGTTLRDVIDAIGGGAERGHRLTSAISGTANAMLPAELFDTPLCYEAMEQIGSGLGTGGFIVFDDRTDPVAVVQGVSRFLAVESCGQCEPCKDDGLRLAELLDALRRSEAGEREVRDIEQRVDNVAVGARCALARQQQAVVGGFLRTFADPVLLHVAGRAAPASSELIAPIVDIVDDRAVLDTTFASKQPDWSYDDIDSGAVPAAKWGDRTVDELPQPPESADAEERPPSRQPPTDAFAWPAELRRRIRDDLAMLDDGVTADDDRVEDLAARVIVYVDVMQRIVYPWLDRVTDPSGADVAWDADRDARRALDAAVAFEGGERRVSVDDLRRAIDAQFTADEERVEPALRAGLSVEQRRDLADAIAEGFASTTGAPPATADEAVPTADHQR